MFLKLASTFLSLLTLTSATIPITLSVLNFTDPAFPETQVGIYNNQLLALSPSVPPSIFHLEDILHHESNIGKDLSFTNTSTHLTYYPFRKTIGQSPYDVLTSLEWRNEHPRFSFRPKVTALGEGRWELRYAYGDLCLNQTEGLQGATGVFIKNYVGSGYLMQPAGRPWYCREVNLVATAVELPVAG